MQITILSSKGQLVIPKSIRQAHGWHSGDKFIVIEQGNGIFLKPVTPYSQLTIDDVIGCTGYHGKKKSLKDMNAGIAKGAQLGHCH